MSSCSSNAGMETSEPLVMASSITLRYTPTHKSDAVLNHSYPAL